jgi:F1F0 ATPase subunit 2
MNDTVYLVLAFFGGMALGAFYFMKLWKAVNKAVEGDMRATGFLTDFFIRTGVVTVGFFIIMSGRWERVVVALCGFIIAREILKRVLGRQNEAV